ncbi:MAG: aminotransferase class III-fold pyridoxal phosphate-dependent enzyme, partial [Thaumarchaeota archaeon]
DNATAMGTKLKEGLQELVGKGGMADVRGLGLMIGIEFDSKQSRDERLARAFKKGLLLLPAGQKAMRVIPPLTITEEEVQGGFELMSHVLSG